MEKTKCICCDNEMSRFLYEEYEQMTAEEKEQVLKEHKDGCAWAKQFNLCFGHSPNIGLGSHEAIKSFRVESVIDLLIEKGIVSKEEIKNRMIKKAGRAVDLNARDDMIKYITEKL